MRKLPLTAAEDLLEIVMRRYERAGTLLTSGRHAEDRGKMLGDVTGRIRKDPGDASMPKNGRNAKKVLTGTEAGCYDFDYKVLRLRLQDVTTSPTRSKTS